MDDTTVGLRLTPVEMTYLAAVLNEKINWLGSEYARLRARAEEADAISMFNRDMDANRLALSLYTSMVRRVEQALDVPFVDAGELVSA